MTSKLSEHVSSLVSSLVTAGITAIHPYEPGKPIEEVERELGSALPPGGVVKLASNENPLGPSPRALEAVRAVLPKVHLYPDGGSFYLRRKLAQVHGTSEHEVALGNGSNEILDLLVRTFCVAGDEVLAPAQTFVCYKLAAQAHGVIYKEAPRGPDFAYRLDALAAAVTPKTKIVFLASPDNPTGVYARKDEVVKLLRSLPPNVVVAIDEAYFEYATAADYPDCLSLRGEHALLVVMRTFSKIYGLAGLRCGYAIAPREIVDYLNRVRNPFNVSAVAQVAALAALDDHEHVARSRAMNAEGMAQIEEGLGRLRIPFIPSQCNFILTDVSPRDGREVFSALLRKGVIVRPMSGYGMPRALRVTIGTPDENRRFLAALGEVLAKA